MDRAGMAIGGFAILIGLAIGVVMIVSPEGLNPAYPIGIAILAPIAFVLGGILVCAHAMGGYALVGITFSALAFCLIAIVNWAAFFAGHVQCRETVSFLGLAVFERYPSEMECRDSLRVIMGCVDAVVLAIVAALAWRRWAGRRGAAPN